MHPPPAAAGRPETEALVRGLLDPGAYPHAADDPQLVETHISWVLLAGDFVYKIKKPLALGFLDFSDLARRRHYCEEEIRLNRPWAPAIYLDVVGITLAGGKPRIGGSGDAVEYAVRMRRFDRCRTLDRQLDDGLLTAADMRELAANIAARHRAADPAPRGERERLLALTESLMWDNFRALESGESQADLAALQSWTKRELDELRPVIAQRFDAGFFRDCHGDLHLGNLVRLDDGITTFDCIEFSADLRNIDVMCDVAFLVMDIESRRRADLAAHFLNRYFEQTGDYESMRLFDLYFVYRCLVRAKVASIRIGEHDDADGRRRDRGELQRYCEMALRQIRGRRPLLVLMHGLSGSGKTWLAERLMAALPAIRIRSDIERKRRFHLDETAASGSGVAEGIYSRDANQDVYAALRELAACVLRSGHGVILDASFLRRSDRRDVLRLAKRCRAQAVIVAATAPESVLRERIATRARARADASEATAAVLDWQLRNADALSRAERLLAIHVDSRDETAVAALAGEIRARAPVALMAADQVPRPGR